jgi:CMP-N-acetylneuraminic acid synthetase
MNKTQPTIVALIPARSGSKRVKDKNIRILAGHPLMAYSIRAAIDSDVFSEVVVSTDAAHYAEIARHYGAEVPFLRPPDFAGDVSPDIEWVRYTLEKLKEYGRSYDCFSILRPTSPFRSAETIRRAWEAFLAEDSVDSLRAVEKCSQHPAKMWVVRGRRMLPLLPFGPPEQPWHSSQYPSLPEIFVQNASLEIAWTRVVEEQGTISGATLMPFVTEGFEGFDVNEQRDWLLAKEITGSARVRLPVVDQAPFQTQDPTG